MEFGAFGFQTLNFRFKVWNLNVLNLFIYIDVYLHNSLVFDTKCCNMVISATNLMLNKILYHRSLPSVTYIKIMAGIQIMALILNIPRPGTFKPFEYWTSPVLRSLLFIKGRVSFLKITHFHSAAALSSPPSV